MVGETPVVVGDSSVVDVRGSVVVSSVLGNAVALVCGVAEELGDVFVVVCTVVSSVVDCVVVAVTSRFVNGLGDFVVADLAAITRS